MNCHTSTEMKTSLPLLLAVLLFNNSACVKDDNDSTPDLPIAVCGIDGMRLEAHVDDSETCFSTSLIGNLADGQLMIGGMHATAGSLALQLDELTVGTHTATQDANHLLLIVGGVTFESSNATPGSITISSHNEGGNHIKGSFTAQLTSPDGSPAKSVSGTFDLTYLEQ